VPPCPIAGASVNGGRGAQFFGRSADFAEHYLNTDDIVPNTGGGCGRRRGRGHVDTGYIVPNAGAGARQGVTPGRTCVWCERPRTTASLHTCSITAPPPLPRNSHSRGQNNKHHALGGEHGGREYPHPRIECLSTRESDTPAAVSMIVVPCCFFHSLLLSQQQYALAECFLCISILGGSARCPIATFTTAG